MVFAKQLVCLLFLLSAPYNSIYTMEIPSYDGSSSLYFPCNKIRAQNLQFFDAKFLQAAASQNREISLSQPTAQHSTTQKELARLDSQKRTELDAQKCLDAKDSIPPQYNPAYLAPFSLPQKLVTIACRPLRYDQAARLPIEEPLREIMTMIDFDQPFNGLIIDPSNKTSSLVEYFAQNPQYNVFTIDIGTLMTQEPIEQALDLMVKDLDKQIQETNRTIIIMQNIECLSLETFNTHFVCRILFEIMNTYNQNIKVSIIGIADNLPMVPNLLHKMFSSTWLLPAMSYSERRDFLATNLNYFSHLKITREWQNLFPFFSKEISQLDRAQFIDTLAQQTEGYSIVALSTLANTIQMHVHGRDEEKILHEVLDTTTNQFGIVQTVGAQFTLKLFNWISRPSLWLRCLALTNSYLDSTSRSNLLKLANHAQYGHREPTIAEFTTDLAVAIGPKLVELAIKKSYGLIWGLIKK